MAVLWVRLTRGLTANGSLHNGSLHNGTQGTDQFSKK